ncbi:MAG: hypothetical protein AB8B69_14260 [Chitinophagales bacterium]
MTTYRKFNLSLFALVIVIFVSSCTNSKKALFTGDYDTTINQTVKKLRNGKNKEKQILLLEEAYAKANARDFSNIAAFKTDGNPEKWLKIYYAFKDIQIRQNKVVPLLPLFVKSENRKANIDTRNFHQDFVAAKQKASEYLYTIAVNNIESNNKSNARIAFDQLNELKSIYPSFRDVDTQMNRARMAGTNHVLIKAVNHSGMVMPYNFEQELMNFRTQSLNENWVQYYPEPIAGVDFDYDVVVRLEQVDVSPEAIREKIFRENKTVQDGWDYVLDAGGNVKKDSLGNDIKVERFVEVYCDVIEIEQHKTARIAGTVQYFNRQTNRLMEQFPITTDAIFANNYITFTGNRKALSSRVRGLCDNGVAPFPADMELLSQANFQLKDMVSDILHDHRRVLAAVN